MWSQEILGLLLTPSDFCLGEESCWHTCFVCLSSSQHQEDLFLIIFFLDKKTSASLLQADFCIKCTSYRWAADEKLPVANRNGYEIMRRIGCYRNTSWCVSCAVLECTG